jgi:serine/threonine protein kinase
LKADNIMLSVEDAAMLNDFERAELESLFPRKAVDKDRTIYLSRSLRKPKDRNYGLPILCDFGEARIGHTQESGPFVQPDVYRAPEIIFEMQWGSAADIWNIGCLVCSSQFS